MIFVNLKQLKFEDNVDSILEEDFDNFDFDVKYVFLDLYNILFEREFYHFIILSFCHFSG